MASALQPHGFQPKIVIIKRKPNQGFGFTLRHFIAYPPETWNASDMYVGKAMETIFIKEVHLNGPAHIAGLQTGDRILTVNDEPVAGVPYSVVVSRIKQTPFLLKLEVVSKECDVLQMYYTDIAHNPESNRFRDVNKFALLNYVSSNNNNSRKTLSFPTTNPIQNMAKISNNCHSEIRQNLKFNDKFSMGASSFNFTSTIPCTTASLSGSNTCDFMARLRKSIEQKEEFLKAVAPQSYPSSFFKTFKSSDSPKRMISGDNVNNIYALNSMGFSENPKGKDDDKSNFTIDSASGNIRLGGGIASTIKDVHYDEHSLYGAKNDEKSNNAIERFKAISPLTLGIPVNEPLSLIKVPSVFDKNIHFKEDYDRKIDFKTSISSKSMMKDNTVVSDQDSDSNAGHKESDLDCIQSDCVMSLQKSTQVLRRFKQSGINDENKLMRRISYLRATNNEDGFPTEVVNTELSNFESKLDIQDKENAGEKSSCFETVTPINSECITESVIGDMEIKSSTIFGKRLTEYRSWRHVKVELKGDVLKIFTGRNSNKSDLSVIELNLKNYELSEDFSSRRKYVFKLQSISNNAQKSSVTEDVLQINNKNNNENTSSSNSSGSGSGGSIQLTEILFKTENSNEMKKWLELLKSRTNRRNSIPESIQEQGKQLAEPQKTAAISSVSTSVYSDDSNNGFKPTLVDGKQQEIETIESPSNSVCSPVIKTRKSEKCDKDLGSPKSKNWRGLLFRKSASGSGSSGGGSTSGPNHSNSSGNVQLSLSRQITGSIGVPLRLCPMSKDNEYVPYIVDVCTKIVESKGLSVVGIYRIPGNKAAISELKDQVNHLDFDWDKINDDIRWEDVNVVSSLLKLFIRSLPDALLPSTFYNNFIEADKCNKGEQKLKEIKYLLDQLPVHSYETLKHIIRHLHRVSKNCDVNLMEPKNLAIIFGPSIIRTPNETLEIAVKDMKHQCCIVELLVSQYEYFFESGAFPNIEDNHSSTVTSVRQQQEQHDHQTTTLLLGNVQKIERKYLHSDKESVAARFIPHLRRRSQSKRSTINSDTYSGESILSLEYSKKLNNEHGGENSEHGSKGGSLEISISLTDEESSNSRISDSGSMSLTTITDTLDSKLRNLRSTSESLSDENDSPSKQQTKINVYRRSNNAHCSTSYDQQQSHQHHQQLQPFNLHDNIPFADESPERAHPSTVSDHKNLFTRNNHNNNNNNNNNCSSSNNNNNNINRDIFSKSHYPNGSKSKLTSTNIHHHDGRDRDENDDDDDSEVSTTSDPKESIIISPLLLERYKTKRKNNNGSYNKLFRSASFNCRNNSTNNKFGNNTSIIGGGGTIAGTGITTISSNLTKDEKTDMNYTKKRQIQNKQNRSIKRRHTVGGPSDYSATITRRTDNDHVLEVGIRIKNVNRRS